MGFDKIRLLKVYEHKFEPDKHKTGDYSVLLVGRIPVRRIDDEYLLEIHRRPGEDELIYLGVNGKGRFNGSLYPLFAADVPVLKAYVWKNMFAPKRKAKGKSQ